MHKCYLFQNLRTKRRPISHNRLFSNLFHFPMYDFLLLLCLFFALCEKWNPWIRTNKKAKNTRKTWQIILWSSSLSGPLLFEFTILSHPVGCVESMRTFNQNDNMADSPVTNTTRSHDVSSEQTSNESIERKSVDRERRISAASVASRTRLAQLIRLASEAETESQTNYKKVVDTVFDSVGQYLCVLIKVFFIHFV